MNGLNFLKKHQPAILDLCFKYEVELLFFYGSVLTNNFSRKSDVDIQLVFPDFDPRNEVAALDRGLKTWELWNELEELFGRKVDLLVGLKITNPYLKQSIESTRKLFYERKGEEIAV